MRKPLTSGQKGAQGEKQVARHLRWLSKKQYIVLSDLMLLQRSEEHTSELQSLV